jgi:iron complex outermembrane receptor protein
VSSRCKRYAEAIARTILLVVPLCLPAISRGQQPSRDLTAESLEDLMNIEVTSASKKVESLSAAPAAIFVITGEEIRRGGFTSIPDALRLAPGIYVAQQNAHVWQVSARGFSNTFNNKMLVLIDGRLVYSPTFGGVWWDVQDPPLEDIDRIEVIRGPGGTLWGANAVNGVINIIMKQASETQGSQVRASAGSGDGYATDVRYGGKATGDFDYRIYGTANDWLPTASASGGNNYDGWNLSQGGIRADWKMSDKNTLTLDGAGYSGRVRDQVDILSATSPPVPTNVQTVVKGGHILARWKHSFSDRSALDVLGYCDWTDRVALVFSDYRNTCDVEVQHAFSLTDHQSLTWGGAVMTSGENWPAEFGITFVPVYRRATTASAFAQYDVDLIPGKLRVIAGSKFEHNSYTGFEYQPQIRAVWTPVRSQTFWTAVSRAVRTPTRVDSDIRDRSFEASSPLTFIDFIGSPTVQSEILHAYDPRHEVNVQSRFDISRHLNFDSAYYYYDAIARLLPPVNRVDVGVSTRAMAGFRFGVWGRNLQSDRQQQATGMTYLSGEIHRSVVFTMVWQSDRGNTTN